MKIFLFILHQLIFLPCMFFGFALSDVIKKNTNSSTPWLLGLTFLWMLVAFGFSGKNEDKNS